MNKRTKEQLNVLSNFGIDVYIKRTSLGLRYKDVAPLANITKSHINMLERGKAGIHYSNAILLAKVLKLPPKSLNVLKPQSGAYNCCAGCEKARNYFKI